MIPLHQRLRALKSLNGGGGSSTPSAALSIFGSAAPNDPWATARLQEEEEQAASAAKEQPLPAPATLRADDSAAPCAAGAALRSWQAVYLVT